jgi:hypothetical protein
MTTNFPGGLDDFQNPNPDTPTRSVNPLLRHARQHQDINDAVEALQVKVGVDESAVTTSLDYRLVTDGLVDSLLAEEWPTIPRVDLDSAAVATGSGNLRMQYFTARHSGTATNVRILSGTTAAGATPTLVRIGLYTVDVSGNITLVASTANDTALLAATNTAYTKALQTPYAIVKGQRYGLGLLVVTAAAVPSVVGRSINGAIQQELNRLPSMANVLSGQTDLPASASFGSFGTSLNPQYIVLQP